MTHFEGLLHAITVLAVFFACLYVVEVHNRPSHAVHPIIQQERN